jgi:hypothetical protein
VEQLLFNFFIVNSEKPKTNMAASRVEIKNNTLQEKYGIAGAPLALDDATLDGGFRNNLKMVCIHCETHLSDCRLRSTISIVAPLSYRLFPLRLLRPVRE